MIVGAYSLNLYCDWSGYSDAKPPTCPRDRWPQGSAVGDFVGRTRTDTIAQARRAGWLVKDAEDICLCPDCRPDPQRGRTSNPGPAGEGERHG